MFLIHFIIHMVVWVALAYLAIALELGDIKRDIGVNTVGARKRFEDEANVFIGGSKGFLLLLFGPFVLILFFLSRGYFTGWKNTFKGLSIALPNYRAWF